MPTHGWRKFATSAAMQHRDVTDIGRATRQREGRARTVGHTAAFLAAAPVRAGGVVVSAVRAMSRFPLTLLVAIAPVAFGARVTPPVGDADHWAVRAATYAHWQEAELAEAHGMTGPRGARKWGVRLAVWDAMGAHNLSNHTKPLYFRTWVPSVGLLGGVFGLYGGWLVEGRLQGSRT